MQVLNGFATMLDVPATAIMSIAFASSSQTRRLLAASSSNATAAADASQTMTVTIQPPVISNGTSSSGPALSSLTAPSVARLLASAEPAQSQSTLGFAVTQPIQSYRIGTCGNGVCEVGERDVMGNNTGNALIQGSCPSDCPAQYMACPSTGKSTCSNRGSCLSSQGVCSCFAG